MSSLEPSMVVVNKPPETRTPGRRDLNSIYRSIDLHSGSRVVWPPEPLPRMSRVEAISAGKRLWRRFAGRAWPGTWRAGRGSHRIYPRDTVMLANPGLGWKRFVHDLSHYLYEQMTSSRNYRGMGPVLFVKGEAKPLLSNAVRENYKTASKRDHSVDHAHLERDMIAMVLEGGWLDGKLQPKPKEAKPKPSVRERNEAKVNAGLVRWTAKLKKAEADARRAKKKLSELRAKKRRYDREIVFRL